MILNPKLFKQGERLLKVQTNVIKFFKIKIEANMKLVKKFLSHLQENSDLRMFFKYKYSLKTIIKTTPIICIVSNETVGKPCS